MLRVLRVVCVYGRALVLPSHTCTHITQNTHRHATQRQNHSTNQKESKKEVRKYMCTYANPNPNPNPTSSSCSNCKCSTLRGPFFMCLSKDLMEGKRTWQRLQQKRGARPETARRWRGGGCEREYVSCVWGECVWVELSLMVGCWRDVSVRAES